MVLHSFLGQTEPAVIKAMTLGQGTLAEQLVIGGSFRMDFIGTYGSNLASINLASNSMRVLAALDAPVTSLASIGSDLYFGGYFGNETAGYLAKIADPSTSIPTQSPTKVTLAPNPVRDQTEVVDAPKNSPYDVHDLSGRVVARGQLSGQTLDLAMLPAGVYWLSLALPTGQTRLKVIKSQ
jgi:hypothetical protein